MISITISARNTKAHNPFLKSSDLLAFTIFNIEFLEDMKMTKSEIFKNGLSCSVVSLTNIILENIATSQKMTMRDGLRAHITFWVS